jgi:hypothetical protein
MGESDPFGELYEACRKLGMVFVARTDPHSVCRTLPTRIRVASGNGG